MSRDYPLPTSGTPTATDRVKLIAFYLAQFHPIPENDLWWGKDFTEWVNVKRAQSMFPGHGLPAVPGELGYYDLRSPEVRRRQAELARAHGVYGFCYHYYWFAGRRVLERPLQEVLESGDPDFPFCISWANENWTRSWDGMEQDILLAQEHSLENDAQFIEDALPILKDPRYIRCDGKPVLLVYRAKLLTDAAATTECWRKRCMSAGLPGLHLVAVQRDITDPRPLGFDALVEFPPHGLHFERINEDVSGLDESFRGNIYDYAASMRQACQPRATDFPLYRGIMPSWDNTPRRMHDAQIFHGASPALYQQWLETILRESNSRQGNGDQFVFVNGWNEWAEGAMLEPTQDLGKDYLEATRTALQNSRIRL